MGILRINSFADGENRPRYEISYRIYSSRARKDRGRYARHSGGSLTEAVAVANLFVKDGVIAQTIGREGKPLKTFRRRIRLTRFQGPVVALIDNGTAGAAEVVASALLDRNRGQVVGEEFWRWNRTTTLFTARWRWSAADDREWASANGKTFVGEDRARSGVAPTVEVKGQEISESVDPDELTGNDDDEIASPRQGMRSEKRRQLLRSNPLPRIFN